MEQTTQQVTQKPSLPIKTKIAAWWMIIIGGICLTVSTKLYNEMQSASGCLMGYIIIYPIAIAGVGLFFPGFLILWKKRWGWWLAVIVLSIGTIIVGGTIISGIISAPEILERGIPVSIETQELVGFLIPLIPLIPLILLLLDRKNFWKIAS